MKTKDSILITKSKAQMSSTIGIREICDMQRILARYQEKSEITISLNEVSIKLK